MLKSHAGRRRRPHPCLLPPSLLSIILHLLLVFVLLIQLDRCIGSLQQHWGRTTSHLDKQQLSYLGGVGHRASCGRGHWMPLKHAKPRSMALVKWQPPDWADDKLKSLFWIEINPISRYVYFSILIYTWKKGVKLSNCRVARLDMSFWNLIIPFSPTYFGPDHLRVNDAI